MKNYLKALLSRLITEEKLLFKSATIYVGAWIVALPTLAAWMQSNWSEVGKYIPVAWQSPSLHALGAIVIIARLRSMVQVPK